MSKRAPNALAVPVRRATQPSTPVEQRGHRCDRDDAPRGPRRDRRAAPATPHDQQRAAGGDEIGGADVRSRPPADDSREALKPHCAACRPTPRALLDRRARPRRDPRRAAAAARGRGRRGPDAVQRHQPRHRSARVPGRVPAERAPADARAVSGRRVPRAGQVRLRQRRRRRARAARAAAARSSPSIRIRPATSCRPAVHVLPDDVPARTGGAGRQSRDRDQRGCGTRRPHVGDRVAVVGAGTVGCLVAWLAGRIPGCEVELVDVDRRGEAIAAVSACASRRRPPPPGRRRRRDPRERSPGRPRLALRLAGFEARWSS